nr:protein ABCI12, chloroplastic [Tanacetum cinerariifolium]
MQGNFLLSGILFLMLGLGADTLPMVVQSRTPPPLMMGLPSIPPSYDGYSYLLFKLRPLQLTRKGLSAASTSACLTFTVRIVALRIVSQRIKWQQLATMETVEVFFTYIHRTFKNIFNHTEQITQAITMRGLAIIKAQEDDDSNLNVIFALKVKDRQKKRGTTKVSGQMKKEMPSLRNKLKKMNMWNKSIVMLIRDPSGDGGGTGSCNGGKRRGLWSIKR